MREQVERKEKALHASMIAKALEGNVQAYLALMSYAYGTPAKVEPDELDLNVNQGDGPRGTDLSSMLSLAEQLGISVEGKASNTS